MLQLFHENAVDITDEGCVSEVAEHGHLECLQFIHACGGNLNHLSPNTLRNVCYDGHYDVLRYLLAHGATPTDNYRELATCAGYDTY